MDTQRGTIRRVDPDEAQRYTMDTVVQVLLEHYPDAAELPFSWLTVLALLPELHLRGVHAEWTPARDGLQFSAFVPVYELKGFWGFHGSDEEFEALLLDIDPSTPICLFTMHIEGEPTRCVEPFIREDLGL